MKLFKNLNCRPSLIIDGKPMLYNYFSIDYLNGEIPWSYNGRIMSSTHTNNGGGTLEVLLRNGQYLQSTWNECWVGISPTGRERKCIST